jgi:hypothetical protein
VKLSNSNEFDFLSKNLFGCGQQWCSSSSIVHSKTVLNEEIQFWNYFLNLYIVDPNKTIETVLAFYFHSRNSLIKILLGLQVILAHWRVM